MADGKRDDQFAYMSAGELREKARELMVALESTTIQRNEASESATRQRETVRGFVAGSDPTPATDGVTLTPGQLWHRLLHAPVEGRMDALQRALSAQSTAMSCFQQDHTRLIADLRDQNVFVRERLRAALGFDDTMAPTTLDGLVTAVQALRNVMVDGLAKRGTRVEPTDEDYPADLLDDFPVEPDTKEKIGASLKKAGIELTSLCKFEWGQTPEAADAAICYEHCCGVANPLHAVAHSCAQCGAVLSHEDAERMANQ